MDDTTIIVKNGSGKPEPDSLEVAELALDVTDGALYSKLQDGDIHQLNDGADGGTGSSVHIGDTPPDNPQEGQQWMEVPADGDATMWIYDGANWLQQPGGKDGADGTDGVDGLWTDEGNGSISYSGSIDVDGDAAFSGIAKASAFETQANNFASTTYTGASSATNGVCVGLNGNGDFDINCRDGGDFNFIQSGLNRLQINANGDARFSGKVTSDTAVSKSLVLTDQSTPSSPMLDIRGTTDSVTAVGLYSSGTGTTRVQYNKDFALGKTTDYELSGFTPHLIIDGGSGNATFTGSVTSNDSKVAAFRGADGGYVAMDITNPKGMGIYINSGNDSTVEILENGDATFSGSVSAEELKATNAYIKTASVGGNTGTALGSIDGFLLLNNGFTSFQPSVDDKLDLGKVDGRFKNAHFSGSVNSNFLRSQRVIQDGSPVVDAKGLIKTLTTLRNATKDETTIKGLRDAIGNAIGGLIEEFENQIATMPAEDSE